MSAPDNGPSVDEEAIVRPICPRCGLPMWSLQRDRCDACRLTALALERAVHVVTADVHHGLRNGCTCPTCKHDLSRIVAFRVHCTACDGNTERCCDGQGEARDFARLDGCNTYTDNGKIRPKRARKQPRQPWDIQAA